MILSHDNNSHQVSREDSQTSLRKGFLPIETRESHFLFLSAPRPTEPFYTSILHTQVLLHSLSLSGWWTSCWKRVCLSDTKEEEGKSQVSSRSNQKKTKRERHLIVQWWSLSLIMMILMLWSLILSRYCKTSHSIIHKPFDTRDDVITCWYTLKDKRELMWQYNLSFLVVFYVLTLCYDSSLSYTIDFLSSSSISRLTRKERTERHLCLCMWLSVLLWTVLVFVVIVVVRDDCCYWKRRRRGCWRRCPMSRFLHHHPHHRQHHHYHPTPLTSTSVVPSQPTVQHVAPPPHYLFPRSLSPMAPPTTTLMSPSILSDVWSVEEGTTPTPTPTTHPIGEGTSSRPSPSVDYNPADRQDRNVTACSAIRRFEVSVEMFFLSFFFRFWEFWEFCDKSHVHVRVVDFFSVYGQEWPFPSFSGGQWKMRNEVYNNITTYHNWTIEVTSVTGDNEETCVCLRVLARHERFFVCFYNTHACRLSCSHIIRFVRRHKQNRR